MTSRLALLALALATSVGLPAADKTLTVFMYSEYIDPALPEEFEKRTGTKVDIQLYEAQEELVAKLRTGGAGQYDVIVASCTVIPQLVALKLVAPLDAAKLPNTAGIGKEFRGRSYDPQDVYSRAYLWGTTGVIYDSSKVTPPSDPPSWMWLLDPAKPPGPVQLMDEMRVMLGLTQLSQGKAMNSRNKEEIRAAAEQLIKAKSAPQSLGFGGGVDGKNKVQAGQAVAAVVYSGDACRAIAEKPELRYVIPAEGGEIWIDNLLITAQAPYPAEAHAFIDFMLEPANAARNADFIQYPTPVEAALPKVKAEDRANPVIYPDAATMKRLHMVDDLGKENKLYETMWTMVKSR